MLHVASGGTLRRSSASCTGGGGNQGRAGTHCGTAQPPAQEGEGIRAGQGHIAAQLSLLHREGEGRGEEEDMRPERGGTEEDVKGW